MIRNKKNAYLTLGALAIAAIIFPELHALADTAVQSVAPVSVAPASATTLPTGDFFEQVLATIKAFGGLVWMLKIASIITLIAASMKVSFMQPVWNVFGNFKVLVSPILSLVIGLLTVLATGPFSWAAVGAYLFSGSGSIILHELMDALKSVPGVSGIYLTLINLFTKMLGGKDPYAAPSDSTSSATNSSS